MSEEPRAASGRRRPRTRRLLRHPSRLAAKVDAAEPGADSEQDLPAAPDATPGDRTSELELSREQLNIVIEDDDSEASEPEPNTTKLERSLTEPAEPMAEVAQASAAGGPAEELAAAETSATPSSAPEADAETKPKIRLTEANARRHSPPPPASLAEQSQATSAPTEVASTASTVSMAGTPPQGDDAYNSSRKGPIPALAAGAVAALPGAGRVPSPVPSGEGIVRNSLLPRLTIDTDPLRRDSDVPTRPRIPLTQDMALAAGRITSQDVAPYQAEEGPLRSRLSHRGATQTDATGGAAPSVIVARAHVISDAPPANDRPESIETRRSRRPRPDSEEFEPLDLDDESTDEMARLEVPAVEGQGLSISQELPVRVSRTPPPPPAHGPSKRGAITGQHLTGAAVGAQRGAPPPPPPTSTPRKPAAPSRKATGRKRAWWEVLFSDDYIRTLPKASQSAIQKQVNFMEASLGIKRGDSVLDVGCGLGQHALEFARRGYLVVALDLALSMITRAAEEAQQRGLRINFLHKDIRDIGFEGTFDAVICVGTTFGFFDDEQNRSVLMRLAHALKPGGRLLLDVVNRDFVIASQPNLVWFEGEGCVVMEESDFNFYSSRLHVKRTMMRDDGRQSDVEYNLRLYSVHELGQLLKQCGFVIREVSGQEATRGYFFGAQSARIVLLAERRPFTRTQSGDEAAPSVGQEH